MTTPLTTRVIQMRQVSYLLPKNPAGRYPSMFCTGYPRDDPQKPENFVKVSRPVSEIFGIFHFPRVSYTLITESLIHYTPTNTHSHAIYCIDCEIALHSGIKRWDAAGSQAHSDGKR